MSIFFAALILIVSALLLLIAQKWYLVSKTNTKGPGFFYVPTRSNFFTAMSSWVIQNKVTKGFVHFWLGRTLVFTAIDPDSAKFILKSHDVEKSTGLQISKYIGEQFGQNLVSVNGEVWRKQRSVVNYAFQSKAYETYYPIFLQMTNKVLSKIEAQTKRGDVNIIKLMQSFTLDLLGNSIFHHDFGSLDGSFDEYYNSYKFILGLFGNTLIRLIPFSESLPIAPMNQLRPAVDKMHELFEKLVADHRKSNSGGDVLDHMLAAADTPVTGLTPTELYSNVWIFFIAGHETTASSLTSAFYELSKHPEIQDKLYEEINRVVGKDVDPTIAQLYELHYLDQFISENMRMHPPVHALPNRRVLKDIHYGDQFIPKDSMVGLNIGAIHKNPEYWPEPEKFDPDRFSPENKKGRHNFAYLPFSLGPRMCIGNEFSLIEQRLLLSKALQKFVISPPKRKQAWSNIDDTVGIGNTKFPVELQFTPRK